MPSIGAIGSGNDPRLQRMEAARSIASASESRALVPVSPVTTSERLAEGSRRAAPTFLAHLAATRLRAPQTRAARRAEPAEAAATYGAALVPPTIAGRVFRCSV